MAFVEILPDQKGLTAAAFLEQTLCHFRTKLCRPQPLLLATNSGGFFCWRDLSGPTVTYPPFTGSVVGSSAELGNLAIGPELR